VSTADQSQVDGDHYRKLGEFQPWNVLQRWLTPEEFRGYMKGTAIVYLARERDKGGDIDIAKALHYLQKLGEQPQEPKGPDVQGPRWWAHTGSAVPPIEIESPRDLVKVRLKLGAGELFGAACDFDWSQVAYWRPIYGIQRSNK
jgi:hypothetical protein